MKQTLSVELGIYGEKLEEYNKQIADIKKDLTDVREDQIININKIELTDIELAKYKVSNTKELGTTDKRISKVERNINTGGIR